MLSALEEGDAARGVAGSDLKAGVAGAGVFGGFHASKYALMDDVTLTAVFDPNLARAETLAKAHGGAAYDDYGAFLAAVDVVSITAPAVAHEALGARALNANRHVYMEKPLALDASTADALIASASARGLALHVGHQERRVLSALGMPLNDGGVARRVEFVRTGPASGRCEDVSVVFDLMIHDLDLAGLFGFSEPLRVDAAGDAHETAATVLFEGGRQASFYASRRSEQKRRAVIAEYDDGRVEIDFLARTRVSTRNADDAAPHFAPPADPLGDNVRAFVNAARGVRHDGVTAASARHAVALAAMIETERAALDAMAAAAQINRTIKTNSANRGAIKTAVETAANEGTL